MKGVKSETSEEEDVVVGNISDLGSLTVQNGGLKSNFKYSIRQSKHRGKICQDGNILKSL